MMTAMDRTTVAVIQEVGSGWSPKASPSPATAGRW